MVEAIEEVIFPAISLVFLLLGIVLLASILFSAFNPYDQIAFLNAEKLRAKIDEACFKGTGVEVSMDSFELRQNKPFATWIFTVLPRWLIRSSGDPNYVIYYESFPPGEATGWEIYHDMQNRLIVPITEEFLKNPTDVNGNTIPNTPEKAPYPASLVEEYVKQVAKKSEDKNVGPIDSVIISNIVLSEDFRSDFVFKKPEAVGETDNWKGGIVPETKSAQQRFFSYGKWNKQGEETKIPLGGDNQFVFSNYLGLSPVEKTAIKYMPCGENSLCLKTRSGVYSFPLRVCNKNDPNEIKSIQLNWDGGSHVSLGDEITTQAKAAVAIGAMLLKSGIIFKSGATALLIDAIRDIFKYRTSYKVGDFYAASPCALSSEDLPDEDYSINIKKTPCSKNLCDSYISYPLYQYNAKSQELSPAGEHYVCTQALGDHMSSLPPTGLDSGDCIEINIKSLTNGYCWTPYPRQSGGVERQTIWKEQTKKLSRDLATSISLFFGFPIYENTNFIASSSDIDNIIVLNPTGTILKKIEGMFGDFDRKWWWGWP